jgi:NTP pyrophosphatase (non-canonical NTP hydrolase)
MDYAPILSIDEIQYRQLIWSQENFPEHLPHRAVLGVCEEAGELAHEQLKLEQGIRGDQETHILKAKDAVGDIVIYLMEFCNQKGWNFNEIVSDTWLEVAKRDWKNNPETGISEE